MVDVFDLDAFLSEEDQPVSPPQQTQETQPVQVDDSVFDLDGILGVSDSTPQPIQQSITKEDQGIRDRILNDANIAIEEFGRTVATNFGLDGPQLEQNIGNVGQESNTIESGVASGIGQLGGDALTVGGLASAGAIAGSVVPGVGNVVGGAIGGLVGAGLTVFNGLRREYNQAFDDVLAQGGTEEQAKVAGTRTLPAGILAEAADTFIIGKLIPKKLAKAGAEEVIEQGVNRINKVKSVLFGGAAEGLTEGLQQASSNAAVDTSLDEDKSFIGETLRNIPTEETGRAATVGAIVGGAVKGGLDTAVDFVQKATNPETKTEQDKVAENVAQAITQVQDEDSSVKEVPVPKAVATKEQLDTLVADEEGVTTQENQDGTVSLVEEVIEVNGEDLVSSTEVESTDSPNLLSTESDTDIQPIENNDSTAGAAKATLFKDQKGASTLSESGKLTDDVALSLSEGFKYVPITLKGETNKAKKEIANRGLATVATEVSDSLSKGTLNVENTAKAASLIELTTEEVNLAREAGDEARAVQMEDFQQQLAEQFVDVGTEAGQIINFFKVFKKANPRTIVDGLLKGAERQGIDTSKLSKDTLTRVDEIAVDLRKARDNSTVQRELSREIVFEVAKDQIFNPKKPGSFLKDSANIALGVYYDSMLSGLSTQAVNVGAGAGNFAFEAFAQFAGDFGSSIAKRDVSNAVGSFIDIGRGARGVLNSLIDNAPKVASATFRGKQIRGNALKFDVDSISGLDRVRNKIDNQIKNTKSKISKSALKRLKEATFFFDASQRLLSTADSFVGVTTQDFMTNYLASKQARQKGVSSEYLDLIGLSESKLKKAEIASINNSKLLLDNDEKADFQKIKNFDQLNKAIKKAKGSKRKALKRLKRDALLDQYEFIQQNLPKDIRQEAEVFRDEVLFTKEPEGILGNFVKFVDSLTKGTNEFVPGSGTVGKTAIFPFTRIVANVANRVLDFTPVGALRAAKGSDSFSTRGNKRKFTPNEVKRKYVNAIVGTAGVAIVKALAFDELEKEEPNFLITGAIKQKSFGTKKFNKDLLTPNSIILKNGTALNYREIPGLSSILSTVGNLSDAKRFDKRFDEKDYEKLAGIIISSQLATVTDSSFASGIKDVSRLVTGEIDTVEFLQKVAKRSTSAVLPKRGVIADISRMFGSIKREVRTADSYEQAFLSAIPWVEGDNGKPALNRWGQPLRNSFERFIRKPSQDVVDEYLAENNILVQGPVQGYPRKVGVSARGLSKSQREELTDLKDFLAGAADYFTPNQAYELQKKAGQSAYDRILNEVVTEDIKGEEAEKAVRDIISEERSNIKRDIILRDFID